MISCAEMFVQALVRLLSVGVSVAMIGLACWSPLLAAPQSSGESAGPVIVGRIMYRGPVPAPIQIEVNRDPDVCGRTMSITTLSVDAATHGLRNAIVHVEMGEAAVPAAGSAETLVVVRNKQCRFHPHVAAGQVGNGMETINDDPLMHNTNITLGSGTVLNVAMVAGGPTIKKSVKRPGLYLLKCNVHKFMQAYRMVFNDPYFDQTTEAGQYEITSASPGLHRISVWHETLGLLEKEVLVPARGTVVVDLEYK